MSRIGLALSGGGFRATLYHLGVLRFLRDADILPRVSHITSVSGGTIMSAHMVTNWNRYTGSEQDYDEAAAELLDFVRLDIRNRVVRRFPLAVAGNWMRWLARQGRSRRLTRPGLLEGHYEKYLFGDKCLYELPAVPQLHMLATNVNEGCLCSFTRSGLLVERRMPGGGTRFEAVPSALATIPMAVTASSAFPGFFPPLQLTAKDVGADESRFPPHLLTDGGVYDNLGVRMFRHIQQSWIGHDSPLRADDFVDLDSASQILNEASDANGKKPLGRLGVLVKKRIGEETTGLQRISSDVLPQALWNVIVHDQLYLDPVFENLAPSDEHAADLFRLARRGRELDSGDHLWLNRYLANAAFVEANKGELLNSTKTEFDTVIVSDAGKQFTVSRRTKGGGLLGAAMRASDILMNRVWQLESDHFNAEPDFVFAPMSLTVHLAEDPSALHPEIQHQVTSTRTDLDGFSDLEISGLIRHGYGVMRKVCRSRPDLFGEDLPSTRPWDPTPLGADIPASSTRAASNVTQQARTLQGSSQRKVFSKLLSVRDWPTYVYVPLILLVLISVPYFGYRFYKDASRSAMIVDAIAFSNPDFQHVMQLVRQNPIPGEWEVIIPEEVTDLKPDIISQFELITDTRIFDMRAWVPDSTADEHRVVHYRRMRVRRMPTAATANQQEPDEDEGIFRFQQPVPTREFDLLFDVSGLNPTVRFAPTVLPNGERGYMGEIEFDLSNVPVGDEFDIGFELLATGIQAVPGDPKRLRFPIVTKTNVATMWALLPPGRPYADFSLMAYEPDSPSRVESIEPTYRFHMADGSLFGWMIVAPREDYVYECRWTWQD